MLATSIDRTAIQVDTKMLEYPQIFAQAVTPLLGMREEDIERRLETERRWVWLAQRVDEDLANEIARDAFRRAFGSIVRCQDDARMAPERT